MGTVTAPFSAPDDTERPLFRFRDVGVSYGAMQALSGFSGEIPKGSMLAILGPNGGGKSTLLKLMMGQLRASRGEMRLALPRKGIAYMPQTSDIDRTFPLTVRDVVASGLFNRVGFYHSFTSDHLALIEQAMRETGITALADRALDALSGGQFQRVLFARLLLQHCDVMLLDEPFSGVDAYTVEDLMHLLKSWHQQGKTLIVVTHDLDLVREHFPHTLILARHPVAWGVTEETLTLDNLRTAKALSRQWSQDPRTYAAHPQMTM
ncbi:MAG: metal ABC transporter ATP-binding protein [Holosporales bacterium]